MSQGLRQTRQRRWIQWEVSSHSLWWGGSVCCLTRRKVMQAETEERASSHHTPSQVYQTGWKRIRGRTDELESSCHHFFPPLFKKKKKNCTKQPHNATQVCDFRWHAGVPQAEMACCSTTMLARLVWLITYVFLNNNNGITCRAGWIIDIIDYQRASCG